MSAAQLERLQEHRQRLRLFNVRERLEALLQDATAKETPYADFLDLVLTEEVASKTAKHVTMRTRLARFPFVKSLETFDFSYQPSLDKKQIQTLATCHFIEHGENVVPARAARRRQNPSRRRARPQSDRTGLPRALHDRREHDRGAEPGGQREPARRAAQDLHRAAAVDRRRDRLPADRSRRRQPLLPAH